MFFAFSCSSDCPKTCNCVNVCVHDALPWTATLLHCAQCYWDWLQIHRDPDQEKAVIKDEVRMLYIKSLIKDTSRRPRRHFRVLDLTCCSKHVQTHHYEVLQFCVWWNQLNLLNRIVFH